MIKDNIAEEFNAFSKNYTEDMTRCVPHYLELLNHFKKHIPKDFHPKHILDLGCGNGNVTHTLSELFPQANYTLVDASQDMIDLCKHRFTSLNVNYANSYFNDFEFNSNKYDMVAAGFSLHHCSTEDKLTIYKKIYNGLKPEGIFTCSDLMINKNDVEHKEHLKNWKVFVDKNFPDGEKWSWLMEHYNEFDNPNNITNHLHWLKQAGFRQFSFNAYDNNWTHFKAIKTS